MALPLLAKIGLGFLAYRFLLNGPPLGSNPGAGFGAPVRQTGQVGKSGRRYTVWVWSAPASHFVARSETSGKWISVRTAGGARIPVGSNATGAELDALKADWL